MQHAREHRRHNFIKGVIVVALALSGQGALSETAVFQERQRKAELFASKVLAKTDVTKTFGAFRKIAREQEVVRDLYYANVMRSAQDYLETTRDGPLAKTAHILLCGLESCQSAQESLKQQLAEGHGKGEVYQVGGSVSIPKRLSMAQPQFTSVARSARVQGAVVIKTIIDKQGEVTAVEVLKGLPMGLTESAIEAVEEMKFTPAEREGEPVAVYYTTTTNFRL